MARVVYEHTRGFENIESLDDKNHMLFFYRGKGSFYLKEVAKEDIRGTVSKFIPNQIFPTRMVIALPVQTSEIDARAGGGAN